jgi:RNA polymerase sigma factor (sigma-70 family)
MTAIVEDVATDDVSLLTRYLKDIGQVEFLDASAEQALAQRMAKHDSAARDIFIQKFLPFVVKLARKMARRYELVGISVDDFIQEGNIALMRAVDGFDAAREVRFTTYATPILTRALLRFAQEQMAYYGSAASAAESDAVFEALADEDTPSLEALVASKEGQVRLAQALRVLPEEDRLLLLMRFGFHGDDATLREVGSRLKLSHQGVKKREEKLLAQLKKMLVAA